METVELSNGVKMPIIGYGVYQREFGIKKLIISKNQKDTLSRAAKVWSPDFLKFRQLLP